MPGESDSAFLSRRDGLVPLFNPKTNTPFRKIYSTVQVQPQKRVSYELEPTSAGVAEAHHGRRMST